MSVIWTNHLYERIKQRGLDPSHVDMAARFPDQVVASKTTNSYKHIKDIAGQTITMAVKRQGTDHIITSAWWEPSRGRVVKKRFFLEVWIDRLLQSIEARFISRQKK
jgi:hypothetical protein